MLDRDDRAHKRCADLVLMTREDRLIPAPVLVEIDHLLARFVGPTAIAVLLEEISAGSFAVVDLTTDDYARTTELIRKYADSPIGFVDAAVLAIVERLNEPKLATLDRRHFSMMRPRHVDALQLVPEL